MINIQELYRDVKYESLFTIYQVTLLKTNRSFWNFGLSQCPESHICLHEMFFTIPAFQRHLDPIRAIGYDVLLPPRAGLRK